MFWCYRLHVRLTAIHHDRNYDGLESRGRRKFSEGYRKTRIEEGTKLLLRMDKNGYFIFDCTYGISWQAKWEITINSM